MKMKTKFLWLALAIAVSTPISFPKPAQTAIPPLSERNLQNFSTHIVNGIVTSIQSKKVTSRHGYNFEHTAKVQVARVDLSQSVRDLIKPGQMIEVIYTTLGNNGGRTGSQRQQRPLTKGLKVQLFMVSRDGKFYLLEPNGWKPL